MTVSDAAPRQCAIGRGCHRQCLIRDPHSGELLTLQNPAPRLNGPPAPRDLSLRIYPIPATGMPSRIIAQSGIN